LGEVPEGGGKSYINGAHIDAKLPERGKLQKWQIVQAKQDWGRIPQMTDTGEEKVKENYLGGKDPSALGCFVLVPLLGGIGGEGSAERTKKRALGKKKKRGKQWVAEISPENKYSEL